MGKGSFKDSAHGGPHHRAEALRGGATENLLAPMFRAAPVPSEQLEGSSEALSERLLREGGWRVSVSYRGDCGGGGGGVP